MKFWRTQSTFRSFIFNLLVLFNFEDGSILPSVMLCVRMKTYKNTTDIIQSLAVASTNL